MKFVVVDAVVSENTVHTSIMDLVLILVTHAQTAQTKKRLFSLAIICI